MNAEEAKQIMLDSTVNIDNVLTEVESRAKNGYSFLLYWQHLPDNLIIEIMDLGYSVRRVDGPAKEKLVEISWI